MKYKIVVELRREYNFGLWEPTCSANFFGRAPNNKVSLMEILRRYWPVKGNFTHFDQIDPCTFIIGGTRLYKVMFLPVKEAVHNWMVEGF